MQVFDLSLKRKELTLFPWRVGAARVWSDERHLRLLPGVINGLPDADDYRVRRTLAAAVDDTQRHGVGLPRRKVDGRKFGQSINVRECLIREEAVFVGIPGDEQFVV